MSDAEKEKLEILNLINDPEQVAQLLAEPERVGVPTNQPDAEKEKSETVIIERATRAANREFVEHSETIARFLSKSAQTNPEVFRDTMAAVVDRRPKVLAEQIIAKAFPEAAQKEFASAWRGFGGYFGFTPKREKASAKAKDYLSPGLTSALEGGDRFDDEREILSLREPLNDLLVIGLYGRCNPSDGKWHKSYFAVEKSSPEPAHEITATLPDVSSLREVVLPKPINADIIKTRVKGINRQGQEIGLESNTNSLGETSAKNDSKTEKIVYTFKLEEATASMPEINDSQHTKFKESFFAAYGNELSQPVVHLPEEVKLFLASIEALPPKEKITAIESFVRQIGYYDYKNGEVRGLKSEKSADDRLAIMEARTDELRMGGDLAEKVRGKKYSGVCADFALLTTAILREAGFLSGVATGFMAKGKKVTIKDAHATSFVVWPSTQGNTIFLVDGTPNGTESNVNLPAIEERERLAKERGEALVQKAEAELEEILKAIDSHDEQSIRTLENGKLEEVLNIILKHQVKKPHFLILERLFDYYWYTPLNKIDTEGLAGKVQIRQELSGAVKRLRQKGMSESAEKTAPAGQKLLEMIESFANRLVANKKTTNSKQAYDLLEMIVDMAKDSLDETERKAAYTVINYLRAKKMMSDQK